MFCEVKEKKMLLYKTQVNNSVFFYSKDLIFRRHTTTMGSICSNKHLRLCDYLLY